MIIKYKIFKDKDYEIWVNDIPIKIDPLDKIFLEMANQIAQAKDKYSLKNIEKFTKIFY